jgi:hypothetical protein
MKRIRIYENKENNAKSRVGKHVRMQDHLLVDPIKISKPNI